MGGAVTELDLTLEPERASRLLEGAVIVRGEPAAFELSGSGARQCLQGLLTNDIEKPGDYSLVYGALLTNKGMIVVDGWVVRRPEQLTFLCEREGRTAADAIFRRSIPPRLAQVADRSDTLAVAWLHGEQAIGTLRFAGLGAVPDGVGRVTLGGSVEHPLVIARPGVSAPFRALLIGSGTAIDEAVGALLRTGAHEGGGADREAARILAGWPRLGVEIGDRTLPQEVRYDDIEGVSYTKGCYVGQETVARLHFRGHTNRELRGLMWESAAPLESRLVTNGAGKEVGSVASTLAIGPRRVGLGFVRREIALDSEVTAGGYPARVTALPIGERALPG